MTPVTDVAGNFAGVIAAVTNFGLERKVTQITLPTREPLLIEHPQKSAATEPIPTAAIVFVDGQIVPDVPNDLTPIGEIAWAADRVYLYDRVNNRFYLQFDPVQPKPIEFGLIQKVNSVEAEWVDDYPDVGDRTYYLTVTGTLLSPLIADDPWNPGYFVRTGWVERVGVYPLVYPIMTSAPGSPLNEMAVVSLPGPVAGAAHPYGQEWYFEQYDYVAAMSALASIETAQSAGGFPGEFPVQYTAPQGPFTALFNPTWAKRIPEDTVAPDRTRLRQGHYLVANGSAYKGELLELPVQAMLPVDPNWPMVDPTADRNLVAPVIGTLNVRDVVPFICPAPWTYSGIASLGTTFRLRQPAYVERVN